MSKPINLILHCGASAVKNPETLASVQLPPVKRNDRGRITDQPISHLTVRNQIREALTNNHAKVTEEAQGMTNDGARAFGIMAIDQSPNYPSVKWGNLREDLADQPSKNERVLVVGWRNSHDHKFAQGIAMGSAATVCDNLCFSSEVVVKRRHTRHIMRDLPHVINRAVGRLLHNSRRQEMAFRAMEYTTVNRVNVNDTLVRAMVAKAIPNAAIPKVLAEYQSETHREKHGADTAWSLWNAFTEIYKSDPLPTVMKRSQALHGVFHQLCGIKS